MKKSLVIHTNGELKRNDNTLFFIDYEGKKHPKPVEAISDIYIFSEMTVNTKFLNYMSQYGIPIHFFNYYQYYTGSFYPKETLLSGQLLVQQVDAYSNYSKRLPIAKEFIMAAADNIYRNLRYYNSRGKDVESSMKKIDLFRKNLSDVKKIEELMGVEG